VMYHFERVHVIVVNVRHVFEQNFEYVDLHLLQVMNDIDYLHLVHVGKMVVYDWLIVD
jgi:hypothetical protein